MNPGLFPGQADQTGTAGGCHKPGARPTDRLAGQPERRQPIRRSGRDPGSRPYARTTPKPRKQGWSRKDYPHPPCRIGSAGSPTSSAGGIKQMVRFWAQRPSQAAGKAAVIHTIAVSCCVDATDRSAELSGRETRSARAVNVVRDSEVTGRQCMAYLCVGRNRRPPSNTPNKAQASRAYSQLSTGALMGHQLSGRSASQYGPVDPISSVELISRAESPVSCPACSSLAMELGQVGA